MYKLLSSILALMCLSLTSIAQESIPTATIDVGKSNTISEWQEYISTSEITIEYKFENCDPEMGYDQEQILFRIVNHTGNKVQLDWHMVLYYNLECKTCDYPDEYGYQTVVEPNQSKEGSCSVHSQDFQLKVFSSFNDVNYTSNDRLTSFRLDNLTLTEYAPH